MTTNTRSLSSNKKLREYAQKALDAGWRIEKGHRGSHLKWYPPDPDKDFIVTSSSPSDHRALKKIRRDLRVRGGLDV